MIHTIRLEVCCPFCENTSTMECQTKELDSTLNYFEIGDFVGEYILLLGCTTSCHSNECVDFGITEVGYDSGLGRVFPIEIDVQDGIITGHYSFY